MITLQRTQLIYQLFIRRKKIGWTCAGNAWKWGVSNQTYACQIWLSWPCHESAETDQAVAWTIQWAVPNEILFLYEPGMSIALHRDRHAGVPSDATSTLDQTA